MVKLGQHIWPSARPQTNHNPQMDEPLAHIRMCQRTELAALLGRQISTKQDTHPVENERSTSEPNAGGADSISSKSGKGWDLHTGRERRTLADLFRSPVVPEEALPMLPTKSPPKNTSDANKTEQEAPSSRGKTFPKGLFAAYGGSPVSNSTVASTKTSVDIPVGMVGLAWLGSEPLLLNSGSYSYPSESFRLEQLLSDKTALIQHGSLNRVRIREGHLGVAWVDGRAQLLEPGISVHSCSNFLHTTTDDQNVTEKEFVLGPFRIVTVHDGEVGIKFCNRKPEVLYSGRHCLSISKVEVFAGFESLLRRYSRVCSVTATSRDNVRIEADLTFEWQIGPEDAAAARSANVTDVESAVSRKVSRAFALVMWEHDWGDVKRELATHTSTLQYQEETLQLLPNLSSEICSECRDLFEEGWAVTLWSIQLKRLVTTDTF